MGGLQGALDVAFGFLLSFWAPIMYVRSVLRHNFKYDGNGGPTEENRRSSTRVQAKQSDVNSNLHDLVNELKTKDKFQLQKSAIDTILEKFKGIRPLQIDLRGAIVHNFFPCLVTCCFGSKAARIRKSYDRGADMIDKHLDVRNLIRLSNDIKILKNLIFNTNQLKMFRKQARRYIDVNNESSPVVSEDSADEEYDHHRFIEMNEEELLAFKFQSPVDKKLLLGMLERHV